MSEKGIPEDRAIQIWQACSRLKISRTTLYRWLKDPDMGIVYGRRAGRVYIDATTLPPIKRIE